MSHWSLDAWFLVRFFPTTFTRAGPWLLRVSFCEGHRSVQLAGQHTFGTHCTASASRGGLWRNLSLGWVDSWKNDGFWGQFLCQRKPTFRGHLQGFSPNRQPDFIPWFLVSRKEIEHVISIVLVFFFFAYHHFPTLTKPFGHVCPLQTAFPRDDGNGEKPSLFPVDFQTNLKPIQVGVFLVVTVVTSLEWWGIISMAGRWTFPIQCRIEKKTHGLFCGIHDHTPYSPFISIYHIVCLMYCIEKNSQLWIIMISYQNKYNQPSINTSIIYITTSSCHIWYIYIYTHIYIHTYTHTHIYIFMTGFHFPV